MLYGDKLPLSPNPRLEHLAEPASSDKMEQPVHFAFVEQLLEPDLLQGRQEFRRIRKAFISVFGQ